AVRSDHARDARRDLLAAPRRPPNLVRGRNRRGAEPAARQGRRQRTDSGAAIADADPRSRAARGCGRGGTAVMRAMRTASYEGTKKRTKNTMVRSYKN